MQIEKYYCEKYMGTFIVHLNVNEVYMKGTYIECDYVHIKEKDYRLTMYLSVDDRNSFIDFSTINVTSNLTDLKDVIENYITKDNFSMVKEKMKEAQKKVDELKEMYRQTLKAKEETCECKGYCTVKHFWDCIASHKGEVINEALISAIKLEDAYRDKGINDTRKMFIPEETMNCIKNKDNNV